MPARRATEGVGRPGRWTLGAELGRGSYGVVYGGTLVRGRRSVCFLTFEACVPWLSDTADLGCYRDGAISSILRLFSVDTPHASAIWHHDTPCSELQGPCGSQSCQHKVFRSAGRGQSRGGDRAFERIISPSHCADDRLRILPKA